MDKSAFFLMIAGVAALAGLVILAFNRPLRAALEDSVPRPRASRADHHRSRPTRA